MDKLRNLYRQTQDRQDTARQQRLDARDRLGQSKKLINITLSAVFAMSKAVQYCLIETDTVHNMKGKNRELVVEKVGRG